MPSLRNPFQNPLRGVLPPRAPRRVSVGRFTEDAAFVAVVAAPLGVDWYFGVQIAEHILGWSLPWGVAVPLSLSAPAIVLASLTNRAVLAGDSALVLRLSTLCYAMAAAALGGWYVDRIGDPRQISAFVAGSSLSAVYLWDRRLRRKHRDALRAAGMLDSPLPRFRMMRWVRYPRETWRAFSYALWETEAVSTAEALRWIRGQGFPEPPAPVDLPAPSANGETPSAREPRKPSARRNPRTLRSATDDAELARIRRDFPRGEVSQNALSKKYGWGVPKAQRLRDVVNAERARRTPDGDTAERADADPEPATETA